MYNKKTLLQAMANMNKAKAPKKPKDIITDPKGQWAHPGEVTRIPGNDITMKGVGYPVLGVANNGQRKMMLPGADYTFPGADYVDEYPQMKKGGAKKKKTKSLSGTNKLFLKHPLFENYKNKVYDPTVDYYQDGGEYVEAELTDDEIEEYRRGGYIVEDISVPELTQAQKGIISTKEHTDKKGNKTIKVQKEDGTVYTKVIGKDGKVFNKTFDPKKDSWLTEQTKNLYSKPQGAGNSDWFWAPAALTAIGAAPLIKSGATALGEGLVGVGDAVANATLNKLGKNSFLQATKAAYNAAPSWLPTGASASNLLGATGAAYGVDAYLDKESDVSKANKAAIDNPNFNTVTNAVSENVLNLANFLGIGAGDKIGKTIKHVKNLMPGKKSKTIDDLISKVEELRNGSGSIEEAEKTFEKIKKQSLDFWKTPEGKRRVKKYLDENDLSKYGITPQMYSDMMSDIKFLDQPTILKAREKVAKINQSRDILNKEKFKISDKIWELKANRNKLTDLNNPSTQDLKAIEDIDNELQKLENEMSFNSSQDADYIEIKVKTPNVDKSTGYYDSKKDMIFTGEDWSQPANREQTLYHEWGHSKNLKPHYTLEKWFPGTYKIDPITKKAEDFGKVSPINKRLRSTIEFEKQNSSGIPEHLANKLNLDELYENAQGISELGLQRYTDPKSYYQKAHNYFHESDESNAFLQELLPELMKRGYIKKQEDLISPQMVEDLFKEYRQDSAKKIVEPLRILDIARPTERTVNKITDELNNLHSLLIGAGGAGAAGATLSDDDESKPELKKGGVVTELSDDEIQDYINKGYIVEEQ